MTIESKLPDVGTTIFTIMSKMAADHQAINLSQGYPDFGVPDALLDALNRYARRGENQYPPMHGIAYLREQVAAKTAACYDASIDPESEITITSGATEALFVAINAVARAGDEVIVFDPAYDSYDPAIRLAGARAIHLPLKGSNFRIDWDQVRQVLNNRTRAIILNSPHNPTGSMLSAADLGELANIVESHPLFVISDEVYEHMTYDGHPHTSLISHPVLRNRCFAISSFGKTLHATGWKVGYCLAAPDLTTEFRKVHQFVTFTTHTPTQWAIAEFLEKSPAHYQNLPAFYQQKRDILLDELKQIGFSAMPSQGTYFQLAGYDDLSALNDVDFVTELTKKAGVAAIPVSVFCEAPMEQKLVRFCFAKEDHTLREAADRLRLFFT